MKITFTFAIGALVLSTLFSPTLSQQANAEDSNSTVTKIAPISVPAAVGNESNHIEVYLKVYRKGGYASTGPAISELLTSDCFKISTISGTSLDLTKPYSLNVRYSVSTILLKLDAYVSTSWTNNTKWRMSLSCEKLSPRRFTDDSKNTFEIGELILKPFALDVDWKYPLDPTAQTASASKAITTKDKDYDLRLNSMIAGANVIDYVCVSWGATSNASTIKTDEDKWKATPAWIDPYSLENFYSVETSSSPVQCWLPADYPQSKFSNANGILNFKQSRYLTPDYALIYAVSSNWGLKPVLVANRTVPSAVLQALPKLGIKQTINPAPSLSALKVIGKNQKLELSMTWPKNGASNPLLQAEIAAVDELGLKVTHSVKYGSKSAAVAVPHGGKWTVSVRSGTALSWSSRKTVSIDVPGKPFVGKTNPNFEDENYQSWNPMEPRLLVGRPFTTKLNVYGSPKPKVTITYFDCGAIEAVESITLRAGCKPISSKVSAGLVQSNLLDHYVLAKISASNSFGQDSIYTQTIKVQNFYGGGMSIRIKNLDRGIFELVGKADWGSAKPKVTILDWVTWDAQGNNITPIIGSKGKTAITTTIGSAQYIGVVVKAISKEFGTMEFKVGAYLGR
jgi:hypothetical protein